MGIFNWGKSKQPTTDTQNTPPMEKTRQRVWQHWFSAKTAPLAQQLQTLETALLAADVGLLLTEQLLVQLKKTLPRNSTADQTLTALKNLLCERLQRLHASPFVNTASQLCSILVVGINGAGKTTSIGKLGHYFTQQGTQVMLAAGDTYRAAAIEQLKVWGTRLAIPVIAQQPGADSASVIFDALQAAQARHMDYLLADTAGRLHTQQNLMQELIKVKRVMQKAHPSAPNEIWLVIDGTLGQSSLAQAHAFHEALHLTGLIITKLDGSAKGGALFAITEDLGLPVRFVGLGEQAHDLQPFQPQAFVDACFARPTPHH